LSEGEREWRANGNCRQASSPMNIECLSKYSTSLLVMPPLIKNIPREAGRIGDR
jgi:hypothetical protein